DNFAFRVPAPLGAGPALPPAAVTFRLRTAGLSALSAALEVYDDRGRRVGRDTAAGEPGRDLAVRLARPVPGRTYTARVVAADDSVFAVGSYELSTDYQPAGVAPPPPETGPFDHNYRGEIADDGDADYYAVQAPPAASPQKLNVIAHATPGSPLAPEVEVLD